MRTLAILAVTVVLLGAGPPRPPTRARPGGDLGPNQRGDANVAYSRSYFRGPGGEVATRQSLPPNAMRRGYRYMGDASVVRPLRARARGR